ncbi:hypothetical protein HPB49_005356 [Dermacentor silvarum]|uniref:Uncharacterized protein n=1 Tax=Dermacentor silvarum TaxID=543639 RepID=A0ACB8DVI4_DERSI|nr:hypothetical protein HPB49_005356 [Dermacentor silvarum]
MSAEELNLLSGLWQKLMIHDCEYGWPVRHLMTWCCPLVKAEYLEPGAEGRFRRFVRERPSFFEYDSKLDRVRVAKNSPHAAIERWLVKYLTLQILGGHCDVGAEASDRCQSALPKYMAAHLKAIYGGSLRLFCKAHPSDFTLDSSGAHLAGLTVGCLERIMASYRREGDLVYFFADLLNKIGATGEKPCPGHALSWYLDFMRSNDRRLLFENYRDNLDVFFLLNPANFGMTRAENGSDAPETLPTKLRSEQQIEKQAVEFAAKLIKYVCRLTPELFRSCTEGLPRDVRQYCEAPVKGRLQSIIESGRAVLATNVPRTVIPATSEASTQTATAPTSLPLMCQPAKEAAKNNKPIHRINQKTTTEVISPGGGLELVAALSPLDLKREARKSSSKPKSTDRA